MRSAIAVLALSILAAPAFSIDEYAPLLDEARAALEERVKDPSSLQFRKVFISFGGDVRTVCGEFNAKNSYGGYAGFSRFFHVGGTSVTSIEEGFDKEVLRAMWPNVCGNRSIEIGKM